MEWLRSSSSTVAQLERCSVSCTSRSSSPRVSPSRSTPRRSALRTEPAASMSDAGSPKVHARVSGSRSCPVPWAWVRWSPAASLVRPLKIRSRDSCRRARSPPGAIRRPSTVCLHPALLLEVPPEVVHREAVREQRVARRDRLHPLERLLRVPVGLQEQVVVERLKALEEVPEGALGRVEFPVAELHRRCGSRLRRPGCGPSGRACPRTVGGWARRRPWTAGIPGGAPQGPAPSATRARRRSRGWPCAPPAPGAR